MLVPHGKNRITSKIMQDFLADEAKAVQFSGPPPSLEAFRNQLLKKQQSYSVADRAVLVNALREQNENLTPSELHHLNLLENGAMTITTGHQLMVGGGTAFFEFKILKTIALSRTLSRELGQPVVPVFWMASEDHDFEEVAKIRLGKSVFTWQLDHPKGAVGRLPTNEVATQLADFLDEVTAPNAALELLRKRHWAYQQHSTLSEATRAWVREWAEGMGLLVIDGDDKALKRYASPIWSAEKEGTLSRVIHQTTEELKEAGYKPQVFPREYNLFSLMEGERHRITSPEQIPRDPHAISPNALLRPVYQEWLLPNLAYVGGGGELAYWFQLRDAFKAVKVPMPLLYLRDSAFPETSRSVRALHKIPTDWTHILAVEQEEFLRDRLGYYTRLEHETKQLARPLQHAVDQWNSELIRLYPELQQHADALRVKMENLVQRTTETRFRAIKQRNRALLSHINQVYETAFPGGTFWERRASYADLVAELGYDPKYELLEKMSEIQSGTHILSH